MRTKKGMVKEPKLHEMHSASGRQTYTFKNQHASVMLTEMASDLQHKPKKKQVNDDLQVHGDLRLGRFVN